MDSAQIPHYRLFNQRLSAKPLNQPAEVVRWLVAVQAQDFAGSKWALGLRLSAAQEAAVEAAFNSGEILRTHLLRPTWHYVTPADLRWLLQLTAPRVQMINAGMYRKMNLDSATLNRAAGCFAASLAGGQHLTRAELLLALEQAGIASQGEQRLIYFLMYAELEGVICSGARRGKQFTYALLDERVPPAAPRTRREALAELAARYFASRAPATVHDLAKWSGLTVNDARQGLADVASQLEQVDLDGNVYWYAPPLPTHEDPEPGAYLLSVFDEYLSGYTDRSAIASPAVGAALTALGNGLFHIIVIDGRITGAFRRTQTKTAVTIETNYFMPTTPAQEEAVARAAARLGQFLGLEVRLE